MQIVVERYDYLKINASTLLHSAYTMGSFAHNITSTDMPLTGGRWWPKHACVCATHTSMPPPPPPSSHNLITHLTSHEHTSLPWTCLTGWTGVSRVFQPRFVASSVAIVHSIAGAPSAPLESACGLRDAQPPQFGRLSAPQGLAARTPYLDLNPLLKAASAGALSDVNYLFIADAGNHRIRGLSAVCTMICENGGRCVGSDTCICPAGWTGVDCSAPVCSTPYPFNQVITFASRPY